MTTPEEVGVGAVPEHSEAAHPDVKRIPLVEVFGPTIQGEGSVIGQQTYFLRFGGCDYKCKMCDSMHAVDPHVFGKSSRYLTQLGIFTVFRDFWYAQSRLSTKWITFSGGNPCIHDLSLLVAALKSVHHKIAVETQGTIYQDWLRHCDVITISPKGPGMGEIFEHRKFLTFIRAMGKNISKVALKIVIFGKEDVDFAENIFRMVEAHINPDQCYLSQGNPVLPGNLRYTDTEHAAILRGQYLQIFDMIKSNPVLSGVKFLPQFHVWLYGNKQGV